MVQSARTTNVGDIFTVKCRSYIVIHKHTRPAAYVRNGELMLVLARGNHGWIVLCTGRVVEADMDDLFAGDCLRDFRA